MRYEDASGTDSFTANQAAQSSTLSAHNDADVILAGQLWPGDGQRDHRRGHDQRIGRRRHDRVPAASITAIQGAGGTDTSFSGGKLQIAGQYGVLTIDAQGNYSYVRNQGTPNGVSDVFTYTLAGRDGATDIANLDDQHRQDADGHPGQCGPGRSGSRWRRHASGWRRAFRHPCRRPQSRHRHARRHADDHRRRRGLRAAARARHGRSSFDQPCRAADRFRAARRPPARRRAAAAISRCRLPPLDPGAPLGDLIPPTELHFPPTEVQEVANAEEEEDNPVLITDLTPSVNGGDVIVDEDDLPAGSDTSKESLTGAGTFTISAPDGVESLTVGSLNVIINGVFQAGASMVTPLGNVADHHRLQRRDWRRQLHLHAGRCRNACHGRGRKQPVRRLPGHADRHRRRHRYRHSVSQHHRRRADGA